MATHGMIDLETLDVSATAVILSLGAVRFDPNTMTEPHSLLSIRLNVDEQIALGRTVNDETIEWWGKQTPEAQEAAFSDEGRVSIAEAIAEINKWANGLNSLWAQGILFDFGMLENLYAMAGEPVPWNFWQIRDSRTLLDLMERDPRKDIQEDLHDAAADAYYQAIAVQKTYNHYGFKAKY